MNIRLYRKKRGITQSELSKLSGVCRVSIARYETGVRKPSLDSALKIAKALHCTVEQLEDESNEKAVKSKRSR